MQLTDDQKSKIASSLSEGAGIADIQRLVNQEFKIPMTYMEVRFLLDDLDLDLAAPPAKPEETEASDAKDEPEEAVPADAELMSEGAVTVEVDQVKRPGAALSGSVVFSDGVKAQWFVDSYGRLGLDSDEEGYQPSPEDIETFQVELQKKVQGPAGM